MSKISELFGLCCSNKDSDFKSALRSQICPFTNKICNKMRKSSPSIKIGTCSVKYQNKDIIICPNRLIEHNQIFMDCIHLLTLHEPGNELYLVPEVKIPGGNVDYFLVSANNKKVQDFVGIEIQTMDTTGTVWPERQKFLIEQGIINLNQDAENNKTFGMNWKMTLKTILIQMHHKSETFEYLNKHLVLVIQNPLFEHMKSDFNFNNIKGVRIGDPIHIHSYEFKEESHKMYLKLCERVSTDSDGIAQSLGLNSKSKLELQEIISILEAKINEANRLTI